MAPKKAGKPEEKPTQLFSFGKGSISQYLDVISKFKFDVEIVGVGTLKAKTVQVPATTVSTHIYREGHEPLYDRKFSGNVSWQPLVIEKAVSEYAIVDGPILDWLTKIVNKGSESDDARKTIIVTVKSSATEKITTGQLTQGPALSDKTLIKRKFVFYNAFPIEVSHEVLDAMDSGIYMFQASFAFDKMETYSA